MKVVKVISLSLAVVIMCLFAASCNSQLVATVSIKFISVDENGKEVEELADGNFVVTGTKKNPPTALMAAEQVLQKYEKTYQLTADGHSIGEVFNLKQTDYHDDAFGYFKYWKCTINEKDSQDGRQSATPVYDNDSIVFKWTEGQKEREDTQAVSETVPDTLPETEPETLAETDIGTGDAVD